MSLLFYVDESADKSSHFHLGVLASGSQVAVVERALDDLVDTARDNRSVSSARAELHGADIIAMRPPWDLGRSNIPGLIDLYAEALSLLSIHSLEVISRGVDLAGFKKRYGESSPHPFLFQNLLERLNERLAERHEYGLLIADENHQFGDQMRRDTAKAKEYGTSGYRSQQLDRIVDTVHFVESKHSRLTQLADLAVYIRRRRMHKPESDRRKELAMERLSDLVQSAVPEPTGKYDTVWYP